MIKSNNVSKFSALLRDKAMAISPNINLPQIIHNYQEASIKYTVIPTSFKDEPLPK